MAIDEKEVTSSSVPKGSYKKPTIIEIGDIKDTSGDKKYTQRTLRLTIHENFKPSGRFKIDIEKEEEKKFFCTLNQVLKKIK